MSDWIWDTILFIYLHNNPYIKKTYNLLEKRQPLYNYTGQLCLDLDDRLKLNCIVLIAFRVIANASVTRLWKNNQEKQYKAWRTPHPAR